MPGRGSSLGIRQPRARPPAGRSRCRFKTAIALTSLALATVVAACSPTPDTSLLDAYLAPQNPSWASLPPPSPVPEIARNTRLVGMATRDLRSVFGDPALVRTEGGVQYWRYSFAGCTLDLFVNTKTDRPDSDNRAEVAYFDLRPSTTYGNGAAKTECERLGERLQDIEPIAPSAAPISDSPRL